MSQKGQDEATLKQRNFLSVCSTVVEFPTRIEIWTLNINSSLHVFLQF